MQVNHLSDVEGKIEKFINSLIQQLPILIGSIISAIIILILGIWLIKLVNKIIERVFDKKDIDPSIRNFLGSIINWSLKILLFIVVISQLGVQTSSFIAIIGAAGLAIGMSLQGSLSNFAGGVLILLFKPFKVGDYIASSKGVEGTVQLIDIFNTKLITSENQLVIIPNGELSNSNITNYTELGSRRAYIDIRVSYDTDLRKAKEILLSTIQKNQYAFKNPAPEVVVDSLNDSFITLSVRASADNNDFWKMHEQLLISCNQSLKDASIEIAIPKSDVNIRNVQN